ncbi:hypothetical protein C7534_12768 [Pseudomonas sp. OV226]|jgi:hypothetical protein|nr:hypothetical protein C7534_12768 [Pseudomonas sp. OV226]
MAPGFFMSAIHRWPVGAELARDCVLSVNVNIECDAAIASKLGSYRLRWCQAASE